MPQRLKYESNMCLYRGRTNGNTVQPTTCCVWPASPSIPIRFPAKCYQRRLKSHLAGAASTCSHRGAPQMASLEREERQVGEHVTCSGATPLCMLLVNKLLCTQVYLLFRLFYYRDTEENSKRVQSKCACCINGSQVVAQN